MRNFIFSIIALLVCDIVIAKEYHVKPTGSDTADGSFERPFQTINKAAQKALPGDTITVHEGIYREWVNPLYGGTSNVKRILYRAAEGEKVDIKGSEVIKGWSKEKRESGVWKVTLKNDFFGDYNPFTDKIFGDWFGGSGIHHTGDVYLNDTSLYEVGEVDDVLTPDTIWSVRDPQGTQRVWCAVVDKEQTTIYAYFGKINPNKENVEITVRPTCFYPTRQGVNYITIRGFRISQAATQWAAPTAEQIGMVATHWGKGWIIEDNILKNSRCCGITLGKESSTGHNVDAIDLEKRIDGTLHYMEVIFNALRHGWNRENVGSHIVRNNTISDCEQAGICGSFGGAFCEIYGNHIYNIWVKRQFGGAEMAGIKLHAAVDTYIHHNEIHACGGFGLWLDWMAQGTRVSSNIFYENGEEDLVVEVSHGPYVVDNNFFLSSRSILEYSNGGAFINNLFTGCITQRDDPRYTPYLLNHSTGIKGISVVTAGDHRFYNNVFVGKSADKQTSVYGGTVGYGLDIYESAKWPILAGGNLYINGSKPNSKEIGSVVSDLANIQILMENKSGLYLSLHAEGVPFKSLKTKNINTVNLGTTRLSGFSYEGPDGKSLDLNTDFLGNIRGITPVVGPLEQLSTGDVKIKIR